MAQQVRYGIIGCGMMGQEHMRNIALLPEASVAAFFEPDDGMAALASAIEPAARRVGSLAELLAVEELDCLLIVSPNYCHVAQMEEIAAIRPLPLLVEKPLFTDPEDATKLAAFRDNYPCPVWVAMEYRYMPVIAQFLERSAEATGGIKQLSVREHRFPFLEKVGDWNRFNRYTGGTFVEKCCHFFDLMRLAMGAEPVRVMASAAQAVRIMAARCRTSSTAAMRLLISTMARGRCWNCACLPKAPPIRRSCPPLVPWARSKPLSPVRGGSGRSIWVRPRWRSW